MNLNLKVYGVWGLGFGVWGLGVGVVVRPLGSVGVEGRDIGVGHGWIREDVVLRSQADAGATVLTTNLS